MTDATLHGSHHLLPDFSTGAVGALSVGVLCVTFSAEDHITRFHQRIAFGQAWGLSQKSPAISGTDGTVFLAMGMNT
jgi:hypothetical protein